MHLQTGPPVGFYSLKNFSFVEIVNHLGFSAADEAVTIIHTEGAFTSPSWDTALSVIKHRKQLS